MRIERSNVSQIPSGTKLIFSSSGHVCAYERHKQEMTMFQTSDLYPASSPSGWVVGLILCGRKGPDPQWSTQECFSDHLSLFQPAILFGKLPLSEGGEKPCKKAQPLLIIALSC